MISLRTVRPLKILNFHTFLLDPCILLIFILLYLLTLPGSPNNKTPPVFTFVPIQPSPYALHSLAKNLNPSLHCPSCYTIMAKFQPQVNSVIISFLHCTCSVAAQCRWRGQCACLHSSLPTDSTVPQLCPLQCSALLSSSQPPQQLSQISPLFLNSNPRLSSFLSDDLTISQNYLNALSPTNKLIFLYTSFPPLYFKSILAPVKGQFNLPVH